MALTSSNNATWISLKCSCAKSSCNLHPLEHKARPAVRREASIHSHVRMRHAIPPRYPIQTPEEDSEYSGNRKRDLTESTKTVHKITEDSTPTVQLPTKYSGDFQFGSAVGVNSKVISPTSSRSPSSTSHAANLRSDSSLAQGLNRLSDRICDVPAAVSSVAHFGNESTYSLGHPALSQLISGMQHSDARISYSSCYRNPFIDEDNSLIDLSRTLYDSAEEVSSCSALVSNCCNEERDYSTIGTRVQDGIDCDGGGYSVHGRGKWSVDYCQSECQYVVSRSVDREDTFQESLRDFPDELHKDLGDFESGISLVDSVRCLMIPDDEFPTRTTNATGRPPPRPPYRQMVSTLHGLNPAHMYTLPADHTPNHAIKPPRHPHRILSLDDLCPPEEESFESHFPRDLKTPSSTLTTPSSDSFLSSATERRPTISDGQVGSGNPNLFGTSASNGITNPINRRPSHSGILPRSIATPEMALDFPSSRRKFSVGRGGR